MNGKFYYPHLPGNARIFKHTFEVITAKNQTEFKLEEKSAVDHQRVVGLWVALPGGKSYEGKEIVSEDIFNASYLTLQEDETLVVKRVPLRQIQQANENGYPYFIDMGRLDTVESTIKVSDEVALAAGLDTVFQFTFEFTKPKHIKK